MKSTGRITTKRRAVAGYTALPPSTGGGTGGGGPYNWFTSTLTFASSISSAAINNPVWWAEMTPNPGGPEIEVVSQNLGGTMALSTILVGGQLLGASNTTANAVATARQFHGTTAPNACFCPNMKTSSYVLATRAKIVALNATCSLQMCSWTDETVLTCFLGVVGATSQTNLTLTTTSTVDLGIALPATGTYADFLIYANGTTIQCYLGDGTGNNYVAAGAPQSQTGLPTNPGHWFASVGNGATTTNAAATWDKAFAITTTP